MDFPLDHLLAGGVLPLAALLVAFGFEVVNGFHDTANAVATVIYTNALRPGTAVVLSGVCNALGVLAGGTAVAYSIVHLLPVEILVSAESSAGLAMVLSLLAGAMLWNVGTWYLGLPSSSSHALIGSILGVGLVHRGVGGVNWGKANEVGLSLLLSPALGFLLAGLLLLLARRLLPDPQLYRPPEGQRPPPWWIRGILMGTCSGVSFAHGSNDGQKGMGLILLVLIGLLPTEFALHLHADAGKVHQASAAAEELDRFLADAGVPKPVPGGEDAGPGVRARGLLAEVRGTLAGKDSLEAVAPEERWPYRTRLLELRQALAVWTAQEPGRGVPAELLRALEATVEYVPVWVVLGVALALGIGTMVGWKRIVITVGEKIGKAHLSYGQGACAELVAMGTIALADVGGLPVSTTHVLSSGVAGTMWANGSGVQGATAQKIALAWVLTLPATIGLSGGLYAAGRLFLR
ncbi:MAG: inorganic phosphate transporter [Gemmataceae bacterium]|nr:inorganic phosphate transporter [Gemmataceae bacterium]